MLFTDLAKMKFVDCIKAFKKLLLFKNLLFGIKDNLKCQQTINKEKLKDKI